MSSIIGDIFRGVGELIGGAADFVGDLVFGKSDSVDILIPIVAMLGKAAKCDGRVSRQENAYMNRLYEVWKLDSTQRKRYIDVYNNAKKDKTFDIFYYANEINSCLNKTKEALEFRKTIYMILCEMMLADGQISPEEEKILRSIPKHLDLPNKIYSDFIDNVEFVEDEHDDSENVEFVVAMLGKAAKCDGQVSKQEITYMDSLFEAWELDSTQRKRCIDVFNNAKNDKSVDIFYCARKINSCMNKTKEALEFRKTIYMILFEMMLADGQISPEEDKILRSIPKHLGLPNKIYFDFLECYSSNDSHTQQVSLDECYKILGCSSSASNDEIKRAYKKQIRSYHPDVIASKELAPEFMEFAKQQTQRITEAYETIRKERGF